MQLVDQFVDIKFEEEKSFLEAISKFAFDFVAVIREDDWGILFANETAAKMFGYAHANEMKGVFIFSLQHNHISSDYLKLIRDEINSKGFATREAEFITRKRILFWGRIKLNSFIVKGTNYFLVQIEKIDLVNRQEENLKLEKQYFSTLMQNVVTGVIIVNKAHEILLVNDFALKLLGYQEQEIIGEKIEILIPKRFRKKHIQHHDRFFEQPSSRPMGSELDLFALKRDGSEFAVEISLAYFEKDDTIFTIAFINDITEKKKKENELKLAQKRIAMLIEHAPAAIAMLDTEMKYLVVSKRWLKDYALGDVDIINKSHYEVFPEIGDSLKALHQRCLKGEVFDCREEFFQRSNGRGDWIKWEMYPWYKSANEIGGIILLTEVITERKNAQLALENLNKELEKKVVEKTKNLETLLAREKELGELKSKFVTIASHEFRTPLSTILSSAYLIEKYDKTEDQFKRMKHLDRIIDSVKMLTDILNDFLSVGKIEEGKITPRYSNFNVNDLVTHMVKEMNVVKKKNQKIIYHHKGGLNAFLDPTLLKHIILNLLSNAIKFSADDGLITITTEVTESKFILHVKDNGLGISKEDQQHLFERFFRASNASAIQGTGLGLHIVQKYTEILNGNILCKSELKEGTEFMLTFRMKREEYF